MPYLYRPLGHISTDSLSPPSNDWHLITHGPHSDNIGDFLRRPLSVVLVYTFLYIYIPIDVFIVVLVCLVVKNTRIW